MANNIRKIRRRKEITQDVLYSKTKIWPARLSRIERGIFTASEKEKKSISKALGTPIAEIFPEEK